MLPEQKKRKMRYNVISMLRESGMPPPSEKDEIDEAELLAGAEEDQDNEEGDIPEEPVVPPAEVSTPNLRPRRKKKPASMA